MDSPVTPRRQPATTEYALVTLGNQRIDTRPRIGLQVPAPRRQNARAAAAGNDARPHGEQHTNNRCYRCLGRHLQARCPLQKCFQCKQHGHCAEHCAQRGRGRQLTVPSSMRVRLGRSCCRDSNAPRGWGFKSPPPATAMGKHVMAAACKPGIDACNWRNSNAPSVRVATVKGMRTPDATMDGAAAWSRATNTRAWGGTPRS